MMTHADIVARSMHFPLKNRPSLLQDQKSKVKEMPAGRSIILA